MNHPVLTSFPSAMAIRRLCLPLLLLLPVSGVNASVTLTKSEHHQLKFYGKTKVVARYQQSEMDRWSLKDDASRYGLKGYVKTGDIKWFALGELGTHFGHEDSDTVSTRLSYGGLKWQDFRLYYGKQESLFKNVDSYEFSNKLGGAAHDTRAQFGNNRNENTTYARWRWENWRFEAQYNGERSIDGKARLRVGGQSYSLKETHIESGWAASVRYRHKPLGFDTRLAVQHTDYRLGGLATSMAMASTLGGELWDEVPWKVGAMLGHYQLEDDRAESRSQSVGVSGRVELINGLRSYVVSEWVAGHDKIDGGSEVALTLGSDYQWTSAIKTYAEASQSWYDREKEDEFQFAMGASYQF